MLSLLTGAHSSHYGWYGVRAGASIVFFAFIGFDIVATMAEETKDPQRDVPRGILATLDKDRPYDTITAGLDQLPPPASQAGQAPAEGLLLVREGTFASATTGREFVDVFKDLRVANHVNTYASASFWWTLGGGEYAPHALCCRGLPDPFMFSTMLTGQFNPATE